MYSIFRKVDVLGLSPNSPLPLPGGEDKGEGELKYCLADMNQNRDVTSQGQ